MNSFKFKQFAVSQSRAAMKVGTDGVLLGAWAGVAATDRRILDIGTGTGVIALMMAQRNESARITAVDIDAPSAADARDNAASSPWSDRVEVVCCDVAEYRPAEGFDLILSNPPYFSESLLPPDRSRAAARHTDSLSFAALADSVRRLLNRGGRFALILPTAEALRFRTLAVERGLYPQRVAEVWSTPRSGAIRLLAEYAAEPLPEPPLPERIVIDDGGFTQQYRLLTKDFYLKF